MPLREVRDNYDGLISSGIHAFRNYLLYRIPLVNTLMQRRWQRPAESVEGANLPDARAIKAAVSRSRCSAPAASRPHRSSARRSTPARATRSRSPARSLRTRICSTSGAPGDDRPPRPCSYCNKCLFNLLEHPLACYDERRFDSREAMIEQAFRVFITPPYRSG